MYSETNINGKCSMRIIKGCRGTSTYDQSAPLGAGTSQPLESVHSTLPDKTGEALRRQNKKAVM